MRRLGVVLHDGVTRIGVVGPHTVKHGALDFRLLCEMISLVFSLINAGRCLQLGRCSEGDCNWQLSEGMERLLYKFGLVVKRVGFSVVFGILGVLS